MKYYSEILDKLFNTVEELKDAEHNSTFKEGTDAEKHLTETAKTANTKEVRNKRLKDALKVVETCAQKVNKVNSAIEVIQKKFEDEVDKLINQAPVEEFLDALNNYQKLRASYVADYDVQLEDNLSEDVTRAMDNAHDLLELLLQDDCCNADEESCDSCCTDDSSSDQITFDEKGNFTKSGVTKDGTHWAVSIQTGNDTQIPSFRETFSKLLHSFLS